jgi:hypothetical protein
MLVDIAGRYISANINGSGGTSCKSKSMTLPPGATAGVECIGDFAVDLGGYYLYPNAETALATYTARLADNGVSIGDGTCAGGGPGDEAWWVPTGYTELTSPWRIGCFINQNERPNIRLVCHAGTPQNPSPVIYVGLVLFDSVADLYPWVLGGSTPPGYPPRICDPNGETDTGDLTINDAVARCPTAAEVARVDALIRMTFVDDPSGSELVCRAEDGSADLTAFEKEGYQGVLAMDWVPFDEPLPWTQQPMFDWFTQTVSGIRFEDVENSYCCASDREIVISTGTWYDHAYGWATSEGPCDDCGLYGLPGLLAHEARHAEGYLHTCGTADETFAEMGAWAVHYLWFYWLAEHAKSPFMQSPSGGPIDLNEEVARRMSLAYPSSFCTGAIPDEWAPPATPVPTP